MSAVLGRRRPSLEIEAGSGIVRGYASVFGTLDLARDRIEPGAFAATLRRRGAAGVKMLWQHDPKEPIGRWTTIAEDRHGLMVEGQLALGTARGRDVDELIRAGAVDGLSIGFRALKTRREAGTGVRRLVEIDLWEISVVTFPMQELARIAHTRGRTLIGMAGRFVAGAMRIANPSFQPA